ncbi:MAG: hypothetical protein KF784_01100 [Fimbriimonadaceae bacterium]|nr:hypothetical protein [Fimbriimonadaceae bacterium]
MNSEKAREHFSSYFEGSLDAGLKQQLERALSTNAELQSEYHRFVEVMRQLEALQAPVPEPQFDLHERITRKLDHHIHESQAKQKPSWMLWLKTVSVSAIAVLAIWGAVSQLNRGSIESQAGPGISSAKPQPPFSVTVDSSNSVIVNYKADADKSVTVFNEDGTVLRTVTNQKLEMPVNNPNEETAIVTIQAEGSDETNIIALPGTRMDRVSQSEGKMADFAKAVAAHFHTPIVIVTNDPSVTVRWNLEVGTSPMAVIKAALLGTSYSCEERANGLIWVEKND